MVRAAVFGVMLCLVGTTSPAQEEIDGFDPRQACGQILRGASDMRKHLVAAWAFGYLAASQSDARPVDFGNNRTLLGNLIGACAKDEARSLVSLLSASAPADASTPGSRAHAEALLNQFLASDANLTAMTAALKPTVDDIRAVYAEPLATRLAHMYDAMYTPEARIGPKPEQNAVLLTWATTGNLRDKDAVLREFPGGYKDILSYFIGDQPIVRFKFVTRGETVGLAFDGLIFVNGRWVLMPKPWRALE